MSQWNDAVLHRRVDKALDLYEKLKAKDTLDESDMCIMHILGWFCLEEDTDPEYFIGEDI